MPEPTASQGEDSLDNLVAALRKHPVFKGVSMDAVNQLVSAASPRKVEAGDYIFKQDDRASSLIIFIKGLAVEYKRTGGMECLINYYHDLGILGASSFLESFRRSTSLYANDDCWIMEIEGDWLRKLSEFLPDEAEALAANLGREAGRKVSTVNYKLHKAEQAALIRDTEVHWDPYYR